MSAYPQLTVRLPPETKAKLNTLSLLTNQPIWQIIDKAIGAYVQHLPESERELLGSLADRIVKGDWPVVSHWNATLSMPYTGSRPLPPAAKATKRRRSRQP